MLDKFAPTQYTLKKNPTYWQADKIAPTEVVVPGPGQQPEHEPARRDQRQVRLGVHLPARRARRPTSPATPTHNAYWFPPGGTIGLFLNLTKAPYNNVNFRKGISLSLDRTDDRHQGGERVPRPGQPVRPDPAQPEEVARPEPAGQGRRHAGRHGGAGGLRAGRLHAPRAASSSARTASRPR